MPHEATANATKPPNRNSTVGLAHQGLTAIWAIARVQINVAVAVFADVEVFHDSRARRHPECSASAALIFFRASNAPIGRLMLPSGASGCRRLIRTSCALDRK